MTHSFKVHFFHFIWSTKRRVPCISEDIQSRLYPYMGAIIKNHSSKLIEIGGMPDHVHLLIEMPNLDKYSHFVREVKACSSLWVHKNFPDISEFAWQEGYGSFSVSYSAVPTVQQYIQDQKKHHSNFTFEEEYLKMLKLHNVNFDERFVLG